MVLVSSYLFGLFLNDTGCSLGQVFLSLLGITVLLRGLLISHQACLITLLLLKEELFLLSSFVLFFLLFTVLFVKFVLSVLLSLISVLGRLLSIFTFFLTLLLRILQCLSFLVGFFITDLLGKFVSIVFILAFSTVFVVFVLLVCFFLEALLILLLLEEFGFK